MFRRDIIEKIIKQRGDWELVDENDIHILYSDGNYEPIALYSNYESIALYRLNKDIEKLALEEQELYRQIKQKHSNLTDEQIISSVKDRLIQENLS